MISFTKKQKLIIGGIVLVIICIIVYYFFHLVQAPEELEDNIISDNITQSGIEDKKEDNEIVIHITGAIKKEGIIYLKQGARMIDAIEESGGLLEEANLKDVNFAYVLEDGQKIYIPSINDNETEQVEYITTENGEQVIQQGDNQQKAGKININTASQVELEELSGIGTSTAYKIIEYRKENGKFQSIEDIKQVSGIGEAKFNQIKDFICVK